VKVNLGVLKKLCSMKERKVKRYLKATVPDIDDYGAFLWKQTEGVKILAVAHMDVVFDDKDFKSVTTKNDIIVFSPALDDRLGIFTITHLLPQFGIEVDMLFTTDEEKCLSTASDFTRYCDKEYNWIVEFDRMGTDVVLYDYDCNVELQEDLKSVGFEIGHGSYSDIRDMEDMGVAAFNMGIGYHFQHTERCCASMVDLSTQLKKLQEFVEHYGEVAYEHVPLEKPDVDTDPYWYCRGGKTDRYAHLRDDYRAHTEHWYPQAEDFSDPEDEFDDRFLGDYGKVYRAQACMSGSRRWEELKDN
jgi:hypothetical protein